MFSLDQKLQLILNRALPAESKIRLEVNPIPSHLGYPVTIIKNGMGLETFHIHHYAAIRLVEEGYEWTIHTGKERRLNNE